MQLVDIPGGAFLMGAQKGRYRGDGEEPQRKVTLSPFRIAATSVTNDQFRQFVEATGYRTTAEREGWSFVFQGLLEHPEAYERYPDRAPWWRLVKGATWRAPEGPDTSLSGREDHPVVHISWDDAQAYCTHTRTRLPTEAEWERAARGGLANKTYPWGNALQPRGEHRCNVWQGTFPTQNSLDDGYYSTAPARSFEPNGFGLFNMVGNVWEWCADWFSRDFHLTETREDPTGPAIGMDRVMRGGSYLCHHSYCERYKVYSRSHASPDSSTGHIGFRVAADPE